MLDPLLRLFVDARDEVEAERHLNTLVDQHALPLAKVIVGRKLRTFAGDGPSGTAAHDRDDVIADAMVSLIERLWAVRADVEAAPIENFLNYTATLIHSACAHHIRRRHPERARLKDRLRYVFSTERRLALWTTAEGEVACGLAEWRGRAVEASANRTLRDRIERDDRPWPSMSRTDLTAAAIDLASASGGPVDFDDFVGAAVAASGPIEQREIGDATAVAAREPPHDVAIDQRRRLARLWDEIGSLPVRQRAALLLNLRGPGGAGLLWLLPIVGVATIRQIAQVLEIPAAEFSKLWQEIPMDDAAIAQRLGCTRQQVINLRMAARKRLLNRVEESAMDGRARRKPANLRPVSASLKGNA